MECRLLILVRTRGAARKMLRPPESSRYRSSPIPESLSELSPQPHQTCCGVGAAPRRHRAQPRESTLALEPISGGFYGQIRAVPHLTLQFNPLNPDFGQSRREVPSANRGSILWAASRHGLLPILLVAGRIKAIKLDTNSDHFPCALVWMWVEPQNISCESADEGFPRTSIARSSLTADCYRDTRDSSGFQAPTTAAHILLPPDPTLQFSAHPASQGQRVSRN